MLKQKHFVPYQTTLHVLREVLLIFLSNKWVSTKNLLFFFNKYYSWSLFWFLLITEGALSRLQRNSNFAKRNHLFEIPTIFEKNFNLKEKSKFLHLLRVGDWRAEEARRRETIGAASEVKAILNMKSYLLGHILLHAFDYLKNVYWLLILHFVRVIMSHP